MPGPFVFSFSLYLLVGVAVLMVVEQEDLEVVVLEVLEEVALAVVVLEVVGNI